MSMLDEIADLAFKGITEMLAKVPDRDGIEEPLRKLVGQFTTDWAIRTDFLRIRFTRSMGSREVQSLCPKCNGMGVHDDAKDPHALVICHECDGLNPRWYGEAKIIRVELPEHLIWHPPALVIEPLPHKDFDFS